MRTFKAASMAVSPARISYFRRASYTRPTCSTVSRAGSGYGYARSKSRFKVSASSVTWTTGRPFNQSGSDLTSELESGGGWGNANMSSKIEEARDRICLCTRKSTRSGELRKMTSEPLIDRSKGAGALATSESPSKSESESPLFFPFVLAITSRDDGYSGSKISRSPWGAEKVCRCHVPHDARKSIEQRHVPFAHSLLRSAAALIAIGTLPR